MILIFLLQRYVYYNIQATENIYDAID